MKLRLLGMALILLMPLHAGHSVAAKSDWTPAKALALAEVHRDTMRECKAYAKYRLDEKFKYCDKVDGQRVRIRSLIDWMKTKPKELSDEDFTEIVRYLDESLVDFEYLKEVGVFGGD